MHVGDFSHNVCRCGKLFIGDELIAANDELFEKKFHYEITAFIRVRHTTACTHIMSL